MKILFSVMLFLVANIPAHIGNLRLANGECSVSSLPVESVHTILLHPFRTIAFDVADQFTDVDASERDENVYVIRNAARDDHPTLIVGDDPGDIGIETRFDLRRYQQASVFGRENDVDEDLDDGLRHLRNDTNVRRLQRREILGMANLGLRPIGLTLGFIGQSPLATKHKKPLPQTSLVAKGDEL